MPLPEQLRDRPFRVSEAAALGITPKRLRSADLWAPLHGVRVPRALGWGPLLRARCALLVCPRGTVVVGFDAVAVAGLPLPFSEEQLMAVDPVVAPPLTFRPFERLGIAVDPTPLPRSLPRSTAEGVLRLADADLWLRTALVRPPRPRRAYCVELGRAVLERCDRGVHELEEAVARLPRHERRAGVVLVDEVLDEPPPPGTQGMGAEEAARRLDREPGGIWRNARNAHG